MAARFDAKSHITSKSVDGLSISTQWGTRAQAMRDLARALSVEGKASEAPAILWGGSDGGCTGGLDPFAQGQFDNGGGFGDIGWTEQLWR